jgi:electron transfer flavoprotein alpha subunit
MILVFCELKDNAIRKSSLETLSEARRMANAAKLTVGALFVGPICCKSEAVAAEYGADVIIVVKGDNLNTYSSDNYAKAITEVVLTKRATIILGAATSTGRDLMPRVAARLNAGYAADVTNITIKDGKLQCVRPIYSGKVLATIAFQSNIQTATVRPNIFSATTDIKTVVMESPCSTVGTPMASVKEVVAKDGDKIDITEANIVIAGGRGLEAIDNLRILEELAEVLAGSVIGASRAAVDAGWGIPHSSQVGQTGKVVSPELYIACGISGAIQHVAGMSSSKMIVAINKDPEAPIFKIATHCIVGDVFEIVPELTKMIKATLAKKNN